MFREYRCNVVDGPERALALADRASRPCRDESKRVAMGDFRDEWQRWGHLERGERAHLPRSGLDVVAVPVKDVVGVFELVEHRAAVYVLDGVQPEFKRRHDAIVAATAADRPEEVLVFSRAGDEKFPVGRHHVRRNKVVEGQSEPTREVADAASEGQAADARGRDDAPVLASPNAFVAALKSPHVAPPSARAV